MDETKPFPTDGFKSRKFIATVVGSVLIEGVASVALFLGMMTADQWIGLNQWFWPATLAIFSSATVVEKFRGSKA